MNNSMVAIQVEGADFSYPKGKSVLNHLNLQVNVRERLALLGPNGAGKTTLIRLIIGAMKPNSGRVKTLGADPFTVPSIRGQLGIAHQNSGAEEFLSGWTNLEIHGNFFGLAPLEVHRRVDELCELLGKAPFLSQQVMGLSGGQRRRLQLLKALLSRPSLLVLDEPTIGLDLESRRNFYSAIDTLQLKDGFTVLWTSHQFDEIERTCTRAVILKDGCIAYDHPIAEQGAVERVLKVRLTLTELHSNVLEITGLTSMDGREFMYVGERSRFYVEVLPHVVHRFGLENLEIIKPSLEEVYLEVTKQKSEVTTWDSPHFYSVSG
jgi:ABC-2 type transport system ATP-binding protein